MIFQFTIQRGSFIIITLAFDTEQRVRFITKVMCRFSTNSVLNVTLSSVSLNAPPCGIITSPMLSEDLELVRSSLTFISIYSGHTMYTASLIAKDMHKWMSEMLNERVNVKYTFYLFF